MHGTYLFCLAARKKEILGQLLPPSKIATLFLGTLSTPLRDLASTRNATKTKHTTRTRNYFLGIRADPLGCCDGCPIVRKGKQQIPFPFCRRQFIVLVACGSR